MKPIGTLACGASKLACCALISLSTATSLGAMALLGAAWMLSAGLGGWVGARSSSSKTEASSLEQVFFCSTIFLTVLRKHLGCLLSGGANMTSVLQMALRWSGASAGINWLMAMMGIQCSVQALFFLSQATLLGTFVSTGMIAWRLATAWSQKPNYMPIPSPPHGYSSVIPLSPVPVSPPMDDQRSQAASITVPDIQQKANVALAAGEDLLKDLEILSSELETFCIRLTQTKSPLEDLEQQAQDLYRRSHAFRAPIKIWDQNCIRLLKELQRSDSNTAINPEEFNVLQIRKLEPTKKAIHTQYVTVQQLVNEAALQQSCWQPKDPISASLLQNGYFSSRMPLEYTAQTHVAFYAPNGSWLGTLHHSNDILTSAVWELEGRTHVAVFRDACNNRQLEVWDIAPGTVARRIQTRLLPQDLSLAQPRFLSFSAHGKSIIFMGNFEEDKDEDSFLIQWTWVRDGGDFQRIDRLTWKRAHVNEDDGTLMLSGQRCDDKVVYCQSLSFNEDGVFTSDPSPRLELKDLTPAEPIEAVLPSGNMLCTVKRKGIDAFHHFTCSLLQQDATELSVVSTISLQVPKKESFFYGTILLPHSKTPVFHIRLPDCQGHSHTIRFVHLKTGAQKEFIFDLAPTSRIKQIFNRSPDGQQWLAQCTHRAETSGEWERTPGWRALEIPREAFYEICPEEGVREEALLVENTMKVLQEQLPPDANEPLPLLLLRAVVHEHSLLLFRRITQSVGVAVTEGPSPDSFEGTS